MATYDATKAICYARGDTRPITFQRTQNGAVLDITGFTFQFTVNTDLNPSDATNEQFTLTGVITDAANGLYEFRPSSVNTDLTPKRYYYDVQQVDGSGYIHTIVKSDFDLDQDIEKD